MKFLSVATSALLALGSIVSVANADAYSDAMKEWCGGMFLYLVFFHFSTTQVKANMRFIL